MADKRDRAKELHGQQDVEPPVERKPRPGEENDGGESLLSGRSRELPPDAPEKADRPPDEETEDRR